MMVAELAANKTESTGAHQGEKRLLGVAKLKKEAETLRSIMKGYIGTIDSLNQLNVALLDENLAMKEQMEAVSKENADLVERQENMEDMLEAGQTLQTSAFNRRGVRMLSSGSNATPTAPTEATCCVCASRFSKTASRLWGQDLHLKITDSEGNVLPNEDGNTEFSASRTIDYARERLDACIFYDHPDEGAEEIYSPGTYLVEILEGTTVIGSTEFSLR